MERGGKRLMSGTRKWAEVTVFFNEPDLRG